MDKEAFGFCGAPDRTFGAPDMASGDLRLTESSDTTIESSFCPLPGPGMYYVGAAAAIVIAGWMVCHPFFDGAAPFHFVSSCFLDSVLPGHLSAVGGSIYWQWRQWRRLSLT